MKQQDVPIPLCETCSFESDAVFKNLSKDEIDILNFEKDFRQYKRGDVLYQEGNRINGFFCISKGIIKVFKTGFDGKEQIIRFAKRGDIIAYRSVLTNELACTTAEVIEESHVCFIPSEILLRFVKSNPAFSFELMLLTCHELEEANAYITDIAQKTVRERLAEVLLHLYREFGPDENGSLNISLTREELANIVGTATESVIRLLSEFKTDKYIELQGRKIKIINVAGLEKISNIFG